ncbi:hypothetical protein HHI36_008558 [Cryptolaemus montrouzieri]|uniref:CS domain-containing protein n=1 Tax=Cryptolaemus montrouzieri TaxID=559131 RepID=A0ABD2MSQ1_9CUCU
MQTCLEEIKKDIAELESFQIALKRQRIKSVLNDELRKLSAEKQELEEALKTMRMKSTNVSASENNILVKLDSYAWDQSPKFLKFYVTLPETHNLLSENIECKFFPDSLELLVKDLNGKDYIFTISKFLHAIVPEMSYWRIKIDTITIFLAKSASIKWSHVTKAEKEISEPKKRKYADMKSGKRGVNIITLVKDISGNGDDNRRRTRASTEGQTSRF